MGPHTIKASYLDSVEHYIQGPAIDYFLPLASLPLVSLLSTYYAIVIDCCVKKKDMRRYDG